MDFKTAIKYEDNDEPVEEMTNAIEEILGRLTDIGKKETDILWVGSEDGTLAMGWETFKNKFKGVYYDAGFGASKIADDLVVVFNDNTWLEREEYDGAECWAYKEAPKRKPSSHGYEIIDCDTAGKVGWQDLADLNEWSGSDEEI